MESVKDKSGLKGWVEIAVIGADGEIKDFEVVENLITTVGDQYYAQRGGNVTESQGDVTGMKLGTGTSAATKSGAAAALGTYITGSNELFDSSPTVNAVGSDVGYTIDYVTTWEAGNVTNSAITECVIVNDAGTDATSAASATISRITFTAKNKTASDALIITWKHLFEGA